MTYWNNINLQIGNSPYTANKINSINFRKNAISNYGVTVPDADSFKSENERYFLNKNEIAILAKSSQRIKDLSKEYKIPFNVNMKEMEKLKNGHLKSTKILVSKILSNLPDEIKDNINSSDLLLAANLHDYGKILVPEKYLNKKEALTDEEKAIINLHSELGYELLNQLDLNQNVLRLVKYHHQTPDGNGYPFAKDDFIYDNALQVLKIADEYSALREERSYKSAFTHEEAIDIISKEVEDGQFSKEIFEALKKSF